MGVFDQGTIYAHMNTEHGGIYDVAPQRANQPDPNNVHVLGADNQLLAEQRAELQRLELQRQAAALRRAREEAQRDIFMRATERRIAEQEALEAQRRQEAERRQEGGGWGCTIM